MKEKSSIVSWVAERLAPWAEKHPVLLVLVVIVYFVVPIDLIPEALIGPLGYIDDILILLASIYVRRIGRKKYIDTTAVDS